MSNPDYRLAHIRERSVGSLFFSIFGVLWLLLGFYAFGLLTRWVALALILLLSGFLAIAVRLLRAVPRGIAQDPERERDERRFGWVNAAQGIAIFAAFQVAYRLHHGDLAFPVAVLIVGLHLFALPRSYRLRSNLVTGTILVAAAVLCLILFRGDVMVGAVTLCAGLTLWCGAAWKLKTALQLQTTSAPEGRV